MDDKHDSLFSGSSTAIVVLLLIAGAVAAIVAVNEPQFAAFVAFLRTTWGLTLGILGYGLAILAAVVMLTKRPTDPGQLAGAGALLVAGLLVANPANWGLAVGLAILVVGMLWSSHQRPTAADSHPG